jgi:hypothetical protein
MSEPDGIPVVVDDGSDPENDYAGYGAPGSRA